MKVFLIGYMGVGKTTVGKKLASHLGFSFIDLDQQIETSEGLSIPVIFEQRGALHFREIEGALLRILAGEPGDAVISTGGGAPCHGDNMAFMRSQGITVWLSLSAKMIASRLESGKSTRPIIADIKTEELPGFIETHLEERSPFYAQAHITFNAQDISAAKLKGLAEDIMGRSINRSKP